MYSGFIGSSTMLL